MSPWPTRTPTPAMSRWRACCSRPVCWPALLPSSCYGTVPQAGTPGRTSRPADPEAPRGRQDAKLRYAVLAAAAVHGGTEPDLLEEVAYWQTDDFWQYAMYAAVAYIRAAASRAGVPVRQACQDLSERSGQQAL